MNVQQRGAIDAQVRQAQVTSQAAQGLGTPPQEEFQYKRNPSMDLVDMHTAKKQQELAQKMAQEQGQQGYAGYRGEQQAQAPLVGGSNGQVQVQSAGWQPRSAEAHQMNIQLADRIKSGALDPHTAMIALQHPDVAPDIKQVLSQIVQQTQQAGSPMEVPAEGGSTGLGSIGIPQ